MKVRLLDNTIRYRLRQAEVKQLCAGQEIKQVTFFGNGESNRLSFMLGVSADDAFHLSYKAAAVLVQIPPAVASGWYTTDLVAIEKNFPSVRGETVFILVEKDFKCLDAHREEDEDAYPNPNIRCNK